MQSNSGKYRDLTPAISPAGKLFDQGGSSVEVIHGAPTDLEVPDVISKFTNTNVERPPVGQIRRHYGKANDEQVAANICHGVRSQGSLKVEELVSPAPTTRFEENLLDRKEAIYQSRRDQPLGKGRDLSAYVPDDLDKLGTTFGRATIHSGSAGELINPNQTTKEIEENEMKFHDIYVKTHHDYLVGEPPNRKYDWSKFPKDSAFGLPTPHSNEGEMTKKTLNWADDGKAKTANCEILEKFWERTQPQLGKVLDPNKETRHVSEDHTYGIMLRPDEYGAGDLVHQRSPDGYLRGRDRERSVLHAIRQHLKKCNYHNFNDLSHAFKFYDKNDDKLIDADELRDVCHQLNLPIDDVTLNLLTSYCVGGDDDVTPKKIDYVKFANFLNWKDKMPVPLDGAETATETLSKQIDASMTSHKTSSSVVGALNGVVTDAYRVYGVPTVRSDLPAPLLRRISDRRNYGDESSAYGLINPNLYSNFGLTERDFFMPRSQEEIREIFEAIGVTMSDENFQIAWRRAKSQNGRVCVESFRNVLDVTVA